MLNRFGSKEERIEDEYKKAQEFQEKIAAELLALTSTALKARRKWERMKKSALEEQLIEAEREGQPAVVHKLSKALSGRSGPKTRNHGGARRLQTYDQWRKELAAEVKRRGMSAVPCDFNMEQVIWTSTGVLEKNEERDQSACEETRELGHSIAKRLTTCDKRTVAAPWLAPNELWLQLLFSNWRMVPGRAVGACQRAIETTHVQ